MIKSNWNHPCLFLHGWWTNRNWPSVWVLTSTCWFLTHWLYTAVISSTLGKSGAGIDISSSPAVIRSVSTNINVKAWHSNGCFWVYFYLLSQEPSLISCKTVYLIQIKPWNKFLLSTSRPWKWFGCTTQQFQGHDPQISEMARTYLHREQPAQPRSHTPLTQVAGLHFSPPSRQPNIQFALTELKSLISGISFWISLFPHKSTNTLFLNYILYFGTV